jgi:carbon-monoxide dehydrogenase small subunit
MQTAFHETHALQCGYCTPGMIMASGELPQGEPEPERGGDPGSPGRQLLPLHGYENIIKAVQQAAGQTS